MGLDIGNWRLGLGPLNWSKMMKMMIHDGHDQLEHPGNSLRDP